MGEFDPDAYLASKAAVAESPFDPDAYLAAKLAPSPPTSGAPMPPEDIKGVIQKKFYAKPPSLADSGPAGMSADDEAAAVESLPQWAQNAADAAVSTVKGFVPTSVRQAVDLVTPLGSAAEGFGKLYGAVKDIAGGSTIEQATEKNYPESMVLSEAEKTEPYSKERFAAGFGMLANLGMIYAGGKGLAREASLGAKIDHLYGEKPAEALSTPDEVIPPNPVAPNETSQLGTAGEVAPAVDPLGNISVSESPLPAGEGTGPESAGANAALSPEERASKVDEILSSTEAADVLRGHIDEARSRLADAQTKAIENPELQATVTEAADKLAGIEDQILKSANEAPVPSAAPEVENTGNPAVAPTSDFSTATETTGSDSVTQSPTGIRNAIVDQQRKDRGLPERMDPIRKSNPEAWDSAMSQIDKNPNAGRELVERIKETPAALKPEESALLAHETVTRENNFDSAVEEVNNATTPEALAEAKQRLARARDDVQELYDAGQKAGTESGQSLQARKLMVHQDYSLAKMEATKRAVANDGKPLSEVQLAEVKAAHDKIAELQAKLDAHEANRSITKQAEIYRQIVKESLTSAKETAKKGGTLQSVLDDAAAKARARIIARRGRLQVTVDPLNVAGLVDEAIIGASHIAKGVTKFAEWSKAMVKDFGERISPYLKDLYGRAQKYHDAHAKLFHDTSDTLTPDAVMGKIREGVSAGKELSQQLVYDLARAHVRAGVDGLDNVMEKVTEQLQETHPRITEREVRDKFSGYGETQIPSKEADLVKLREYRRLGQLVSAIEDAQNKEAPKKSGMQRDKPTQAVREKMKELQTEMESNGIETSSPEEQLASRNQARATGLKNQIEDLEKEIATGARTSRGAPIPDTPEVTALKQQRDALKEQVSSIREADPAYIAEQDAKRLSRYKASLQQRTAELQTRTAAGDYSKRPVNQTKLDEEAMRLKADHQRARDEFDRGVERDRLSKRSPLEKTADTLAKWRRAFVLSGPVTLAKLTSAAFERMAFTPLEEGIGAGISKVIPSVAKRAPREGGASIKAEAAAVTEGFTKGMRDAWTLLRTGKSDLDALYGKRDIMPREAVDFIGSLHGALKTVTKRNEFARSFQKRVESAMANGIDTTDPLVQTRLATEAYKDANRSIFMQDNRVVAAYKRAVGALEQPEKSTGKPTVGGKAGATALKILLPVVKVPTNIVAETLQYATGYVTGSIRLANAFRKGIDTLPPEHADLIMRELKKGSLGAAALLLGYFNADNIGGYYQPGEKRKEGDVKATRVRVFGHDIPSYLVHNPLLETLQIGATIRRVSDSKLRKKDDSSQGIGAGVLAAGLGLMDEVPFVRQMLGELPKLLNPRERGQYMGELAKSIVVPTGMQWLATVTDSRDGETVKRAPETIMQNIETGIPGLRKTVPEPVKRHGR